MNYKLISILSSILLFAHISFAQKFDVDTLYKSGAIEKRINVVILGDGYQESEQDQFIEDAQSFTSQFFSTTPYKDYQPYFNVFAIKVPSTESGASHPGTASDVSEPFFEVSTVDNYFGSTFDAYGIHRLLVADNTSAIIRVLGTNFPSYDQVVILVNTPHYGGSGGEFMVASTSESAADVAIHEIGHSFAWLKDEYYAGDQYAGEGINMTKENNHDLVKWKNWIGVDDVGTYPYCCGDWYRPHENCKMRILGEPFCPVCVEGSVKQIHNLIPMIDAYSPTEKVRESSHSETFSVDLVIPKENTLKVEWMLNGEVIHENVSSVTIASSDLEVGANQLQVSVQDTTAFLRIDNYETRHFNTVLWNINATPMQLDQVSEEEVVLKLSPNPVEDVLSINLYHGEKESYRVGVYNLAGQELISKKYRNRSKVGKINLEGLDPGLYIVSLQFENGLRLSQEIVKN